MVRRFFLAWCVLTSCVVSGQPTYVLQGQTFQLRPPEIPGQPDEILWKHNGNKVVEFNGKEEDVYGKYQRRVILDWVTAELDITDVTSEDSGEYELEAYREKQLYHFRYELQVIDRVAKPTISCNMSNGSSNTHGTQATLTCSAEPTHPRSILKYEWQSRGNVLPGPKLTINLEDEDADQIHTCVVSNPLTNEKATFTSKSCYSDSPVALVASLVTIFIVLVCVVLAIVFCKLKRKACFAKTKTTTNKDEEQRSPAESKHLLDQASTLPSHQPLERLQGDGNMQAGVTSHNKDKDNGHRHVEGHNMDLQDETPKKGHVKGCVAIFNSKSNGQSSPSDTHRGLGLEKNTDQDEGAVSSPSPLGRKLDQDSSISKDKADVNEDQLRRNLGNEMEPNPAESKPLLDQASTLPSHQPLDRFQGDGNMEAGVTSHNKDKDNGHRHGEDHNTDLQDETPKKGHVKQQVDKFTPKSNGQSSPPDTQRGLEKNTDQDEGAVSSPSPLGIKPDQDSSISKDKADVNEDQLGRHLGNEMEPDPAESEKKEDENEEAESPPAKGNSPPTADKCPPLTQSSPDMRTREGANSDQVTDETSEENVRESHSTGSVKKQPSSRGSETALHAQDPNLSQDEMHTSKDDQGDLDKALSKDESESDHKSNPKVEEMDSEEDLYLDASQQPHQSPTQTEPDDSKTLNNEAHADPEQGPENMRRPKSEESEEQSACDTADLEKGEGEGEDTAEENKKDQCGPKEEKTGSLNMSEDKEREMKTEIDD
ncbi:neurofilament medium polypeptide-like isoform X7 [Solea senegalensis]|uniref:Neurofilament medium polypeptide-like isoform X7 n=1 Tax=Solea senegalensis TaxID=28829 RepID=A0AAV6QLL6_SOLSE|nr:midasin-like isoform X2 [Solea senegalensis]KAG7493852.1 neurofilament medium polypeptide-like isoform X7 [Solea senegalensis]